MSDQWASFGLDLHLRIDRSPGLRAGLEQALREAVRDGRLTPGTLMPSSRALAQELGVARGTVSQVYEQLTAEGYLAANPRSGTLVAPGPGRLPHRRSPRRWRSGNRSTASTCAPDCPTCRCSPAANGWPPPGTC